LQTRCHRQEFTRRLPFALLDKAHPQRALLVQQFLVAKTDDRQAHQAQPAIFNGHAQLLRPLRRSSTLLPARSGAARLLLARGLDLGQRPVQLPHQRPRFLPLQVIDKADAHNGRAIRKMRKIAGNALKHFVRQYFSIFISGKRYGNISAVQPPNQAFGAGVSPRVRLDGGFDALSKYFQKVVRIHAAQALIDRRQVDNAQQQQAAMVRRLV
jgi:hypothetical protein